MSHMNTFDWRGRRREILVIEDNDINRQMLCALLMDDFDVIEARDGLEGLEQLEAHYKGLALILLDIYMPRCDGFEFLRAKAADERFKSVPVIVTTAGGSVEDEIACLELGANDFIVKPYNSRVIMNRVSNLIRLRETAVIINMLTWDATSGLYNKEFFYRAVEEALVSVEGEFDMVATDIENFKSLTERYGEAQCDILLHELAQRLVSEIDGLIAGGRIGTDLYAFLVEHRMRDWEGIVARVGVGLPVPNVNIKAGVVESLDRDLEVHQVCNRAVSALETIKGRYQVSVAYFDDELHRAQLLEQTIRDSMEAAIAEMQFSVFFQPKVVAHTGRVGGAEALVRWFHPEVGFISPGLFVPIFEKNGFITMLDLFVWEEACKEVARLRELGLPQVPISVNASRLDFDMEDLPERFAELADKYGVNHRLMHVELTETAYSDNPDVVKMLATFKELGFSTELDDFGSGYSSLVSLNTLPLDVMKLDMSMIRKATELDDFRIVESTINLARVLGLKTVVEGVETAEEAARVTEMGCDYIQGYFYSRPLRKEEFEEYLEKHIGT